MVQVRVCMFDFPAIAHALTAQAVTGSLGHSGERAVQAMVASSGSSGSNGVGKEGEMDQSLSLLTAEVGTFNNTRSYPILTFPTPS